MAIKLPGIPELRLHSPFWQNFIMGSIVGLTAGLYQALNLLGAAGGRPNAASTSQAVNATLCAVWFLTSAFSGTVLNTIGPAWTSCMGVLGYVMYVGSFWYYDQTGKEWFPLFAAVLIGTSAGLLYVTMGAISMAYSEEDERGKFIAISSNLQAVGASIGGLIPLIINRDSTVAAGVPQAVYITFVVIMCGAAVLSFALRPPAKIIRDDGTQVATLHSRGFVEELKSNIEIFRDWKLAIMIPAFLPSECYLVYGGSVNAYKNDLRTRCLLSFTAVVLQIFAGYGLYKLLDHKAWRRRTRAFIGLFSVGTPLMAAWIWEMIRVRNYDRSVTPAHLVDWSDDSFVPIFFLFMLNWCSSSLFQYIILYFLSCMTNSPQKAAIYAGVYRSVLAAGEALCFGLDSIDIPFIDEAGGLFAFYATGIIVFFYLATYHISETKYLTGEEGVVVPKHVMADFAREGIVNEETGEVVVSASISKNSQSSEEKISA